MSILEFGQTAAAPARSTTRTLPFSGAGVPVNDRPKAQLWLNYGYVIDGSDRYVNLPMGVPVDTMTELDVKGSNPEWIAQRQAQNDLMQQMQALGMRLEPGEDRVVTEQRIGNVTFQVRLRRAKEENALVASNDLSINLSKLFAPAVAAE